MSVKLTLYEVEQRLLEKGINVEVLEYYNSKTEFPCRCRVCGEKFNIQPKNVFYNSYRTPNCSCYRRRICSLCKKEFNYTRNTQKCCEECQKLYLDKEQRMRIMSKKSFVDYKGGKCEKCGYNKCLGALHFHHKNPSEKLFGISDKERANRSVEEVFRELDKCALLCANCHAEVHWSNKPKQEE